MSHADAAIAIATLIALVLIIRTGEKWFPMITGEEDDK